MTVKSILAATAALTLLAACGERDIILPGERFSIRPEMEIVNEARSINLAAQVSNASWTHRNGGPDHRAPHAALGTSLMQVFSVDIGEGNGKRARITADPVVANGAIYTMDAQSRVSATSTAGAPLWTANLTPSSDNVQDASGGGLAYSNNTLFVTTGFGELIALDGGNGAEIWTQDLDASGGSAPTVFGDLVYVTTRDSTAWAIDVNTGRVSWQISGTPSVGTFSGGAGPAVNSEVALLPFSSGEVVGAFPNGGLKRWSAVVSGERLGSAASKIGDISGDPVIDGDRAYVANVSGRLVALNTFNGDRIWTASEGAVSPVIAAGNSVFLVNDINELVRLDASDGSAVWKVELPQFTETRLRQQRTVFAHYGPILAGGRLIVASSDGQIRSFDPVSGNLISSVAITDGAASNPVVAGGVLYVVSKDGQLVAFR